MSIQTDRGDRAMTYEQIIGRDLYEYLLCGDGIGVRPICRDWVDNCIYFRVFS